MPDLDVLLNEIGPRLDAPLGDGLAARVVVALRPPRSKTRFFRMGVALLALSIGIAAVPASRSAIARWLGVGAVTIRTGVSTPTPTRPGAVSTAPTVQHVKELERRLATIKAELSFNLKVAAPSAGELIDVRLDRTVGDGIVVLSYRKFILTEIASAPEVPPQISKLVGPNDSIEQLRVNGRLGYWVTGPNHRVSFLDRQGELVLDSVRRAGPTLLWESDGVTYRIEGIPDQQDALDVAVSLR